MDNGRNRFFLLKKAPQITTNINIHRKNEINRRKKKKKHSVIHLAAQVQVDLIGWMICVTVCAAYIFYFSVCVKKTSGSLPFHSRQQSFRLLEKLINMTSHLSLFDWINECVLCVCVSVGLCLHENFMAFSYTHTYLYFIRWHFIH